MEPEVGPALDPCYFCILVVGSRTKSAFWQFPHFSHFYHGWEQETWEIRPSRRDPDRRARARSGRANDMDGTG
eukprot:gene7632-biopygen15105